MCGIFGLINNQKLTNDNQFISSVVETLRHRGPDFQNFWSNIDKKILLIHTRLSILDITKNGNQPMLSSSGRFVAVYNGEIYNHKDLRKKILSEKKFSTWKSSSDTETLLEMIEHYGVSETLKQIDGMFAFSIIDQKENIIYMARDKVGEKPLYFGFIDNDFIFSSELKPIKTHPDFKKEIDNYSLNEFIKYGYIKNPNCIYKNLYKLPPASFVKIGLNEIYSNTLKHKFQEQFDCMINKYWNFKLQPLEKKYSFLNFKDTANNLDLELTQAVSKQLLSDVPIGCFLSGGIDSSLITALMQKLSSSKVQTYTIGFSNHFYDESRYAKKIASKLGTDHNEIILDMNDTFDDLQNLWNIYDEPFADSSQIPTLAVSKFASQNVKTVLSGDGGDELFGGYNRYFLTSNLWSKISLIPFPLRKLLSKLIINIPDKFYYLFEKIILNILNNTEVNLLEDKLKKVGERLAYVKSKEDLYFSLLNFWSPEDNILIKYERTANNNLNQFSNIFEENMMYEDKITYLPDDILCKVDRAAMKNSLETRAPFLSTNILNFSYNCPLKYKINNKKKKGKIILKEILKKYLPDELINRPKMGFGIPLREWFNTDKYKNYVFDTLNLKKIKEQNIINHKYLKKILDEHFSGKRNWENRIWITLTFQNWYDNQ